MHRRANTLLLLVAISTFCGHLEAGGLLGDFVQGVGRATGIQPLERLGQGLDDAHRDIKEAIPPYKQIEENGSEFVRKRFLDACNSTFHTVTSAVIARCSNWDARLDGQPEIQKAIATLTDAGIFAANEFNGLQIRWCPLSGAHGIAPDRGKVYLDIGQINDNPENIAALLAHEMTHIRQYRRMGTDEFKCEYSRKFVECQGCQDERHSLEREAYGLENQVYERLVSEGWRICNASKQSKIWIAYAHFSQASWKIEGWREISRGQCSKLTATIPSEEVYYFAKGSDDGVWRGDRRLCLHPSKRFSITDSSPCSGEFEVQGFKTVDVGESRGWTVRLTD